MIEIRNCKILVVDDDPGVCDVLATLLESEGCIVSTANSGEQALEVFSDRVIDLVFTDIQMDGISGIELISRISNLDDNIKTIMMTGYGSYDTVLKALQAGAYDYLEKPLDDHNRIVSVVRKAYEHVLLARDNQDLLGRLKTSHAKLASANSRLTTLNKQLQQLAITDGLTNLYNRRYIDMALQQEFERFDRYRDPFTVLLIDIDHFKTLNDQFGHNSGDLVLKQTAEILLNSARATDTVARFGGEEFILLLARTPTENAHIVAERVRSTIENHRFHGEDQSLNVTVSIGLAGASETQPVSTLNELMMRCDSALYRAKNAGRNQICAHGDEHLDLDNPDIAA
jgi:diguanylate cyclase (GGDEF)-like protein